MHLPADHTARSLNHGHIVSLRSHAPAGRRIWLIADEPSCETLAESLAQDGVFLLRDALGLFYQVAGMVEYLHNHGIMHGVLFPETIFCLDRQHCFLGLPDGETPPEDHDHLQERSREWQPFMAPEVRAGSPPDSRSDVYSLGVLLHWMVTKRVPEGGPSRKLPRPLAELIQRAIDPDPTRRLATITGLVDALQAFPDDDIERFELEIDLAVNAAGFDPRLLWRRHPRKVIGSFVLLAALAAASVWGVKAYNHSQDRKAQAQLAAEQKVAKAASYKRRFDRANELFEKGEYRDALEAFEMFQDDPTVPSLVEPSMAQIARCYGALKDYGAEYTAWLRLLRDYPDTAAAGEANDRVVRIAALALKRYGDLVEVSADRDFIVDGLVADWTGIEPVIKDPLGDASRGGPASDLTALYVAVRGETMYVRFQMGAPPHEGDQYCLAIDLNAFAYDDSTEEWDYQIGIAKGIPPWLWDLRGSRDYDNTKSQKLHGVTFAAQQCVEISFPLSAIGNPTSIGIRAFVNYAGMRQANDVVSRKVLIRWQRNEPEPVMVEGSVLGPAPAAKTPKATKPPHKAPKAPKAPKETNTAPEATPPAAGKKP